ncbi:hypothetical protein M0811_07160 [Anaeramoeba ignava]|uniref:Uncharacterized protein n=1 Tax=Anaeramoeba ignava TaxID=1746090 RepID=A0A9Q0LQU3_ANAIG|nr:hypothetical protein M0811_07160 [Anaeramoeba ignava]
MTDWNPDEKTLLEIHNLLINMQQGNTETQLRVLQDLEQLNQTLVDLNNYFVFVLVQLKQESMMNRQFAGLTLKNNLRKTPKEFLTQILEYVKHQLVFGLMDENIKIRTTCGIVISNITYNYGFHNWPNLVNYLAELLENDSEFAVDGALDCFHKLCEENSNEYETDFLEVDLEVILPKLLVFFFHSNERFRILSLSSFIELLMLMPGELITIMDQFIQNVFKIAQDESIEIRKRVCRVFCLLLKIRTAYLLPFIGDVIQYMLITTQDESPELALEACEFWSFFEDVEDAMTLLTPFMNDLVPLLLQKMIFTENEIEEYIETGEIENPEQNQNQNQQELKFDQEKETQSDDDFGKADYDYTNESQGKWNLRKSSANALETLSYIFADDLLQYLLSHLETNLQNENWIVQEAAVLALGAIAPGCYSGMISSLNQVLTFLIPLMKNENPLLSSITCWTISRYSEWIVDFPSFLSCSLSQQRRVQYAACSSLNSFIVYSGKKIIPFLNDILQVLNQALRKYNQKNRTYLYVLISCVAETAGEELNKQEYIELLMDPLIKQWEKLKDFDFELIAIFETFSTLAVSLKQGFLPFAQPFFTRCMNVIEEILNTYQMAAQSKEETFKGFIPDQGFLNSSLELIGSIIEGLPGNPEIQKMILDSHFTQMIPYLLKDIKSETRQSTLALLGATISSFPKIILPQVPELLPLLIHLLDPSYIFVSQNASWVIGELAMNLPDSIESKLDEIISYLVQIINKLSQSRSVIESVSITIGRLSLTFPQQMASRLQEFLENWSVTLRSIEIPKEKETAYRGLCNLAQINPDVTVSNFVYFCDAILSYTNPSVELNQAFYTILHSFKSELQNHSQWNSLFSSLHPRMKEDLGKRFDLN